MRTTIYKLVQAIGTNIDAPQPIYEFGGGPTGQKRGSIRDCFPGKQFITSDLAPAAGVDRVLDLHDLDLADETVGTAILLDTIEHVERPWRALGEVYRVLKPGSVLVMTSHMYFPIHFYPDDYWRFTASGFRSLLAPFDDSLVASFGLKSLPHTVVAIGFKAPVEAEFKSRLSATLQTWGKKDASSWKETALAILPPFLLAPAYAWYARAEQKTKK